MNILTVDNNPYNLVYLPKEVDNFYFGIFEANKKKKIKDHYFPLLTYLESYSYPALVLNIGNKKIKLPMDWHILITDENFYDIEIMKLTSLNNRGFCSLVYNPISDIVPEAIPIKIVDVYNEIQWYPPKLREASFLVMPIEEKANPKCILCTNDTTNIDKKLGCVDIFGDIHDS